MKKPLAIEILRMARSLARKLWISDLLDSPAAAFEQHDADSSDGGFSDDDGPEDAAGVHTGGNRQEVGQRNFQEPEAEEIHNRGRDGVASTVKRLEHDHAVGIADVAVAENAQAGDCQRNDERIAGEETDDRFREYDEEETDDTEKNHVVKAGSPHGSLRALGLLGAEVLADEGGSGVAEAPTRHEDEDDNADGDGVAGERGGAEDADDAHEADPTGRRNEEMQNAVERHAQETKQDGEVEMNLAAEDTDAFCSAEQAIELVEHADAASGECSQSRAGNAKLGEWSPTENEARIEDQIDDVGDPEQAHGDSGVTSAAEDGVVEKEHHDRSAAAEGDACITGADGNNLRGSTHQAKQIGPVKEARNADDSRDREANGDSLNPGNGCASGIFFADAASDHGRGGKAEAEADSHNEADERFSEADGGDGVRAETTDPENVDDCEKRLQHHFHDHGNGEQENRAIEIAGGEVLVRAAGSFADGAPKRGRRRGDCSLFQRHRDLYDLRGRFPGYKRADAVPAIN